MDPTGDSLKEYIKSGQYFADARTWYKHKYVHPFSQRSFMIILSTVICVVFLGIVININKLLPSVIQVKYSIRTDSSSNKSAQIIHANQISNDPLASIVDILTKNYVLNRESYSYDKLKKQFIFIKNNSTRLVFRRFYNFMNIDNPSSPVMRYQKKVHRSAKIISAKHLNNRKVVMKFNSKAQKAGGTIVEDMIWQVTIDYEIDKINTNLPTGSRFNFTVTDYQLKLIEDRRSK